MRIIFILLIVVIFHSAFASEDKSLLTIKMPSDQFTILVNGRIYELKENAIILKNLKPGEYRIRIYSYNSEGGGPGQKIKEPIYSGFVRIKPDHQINILIDTSGKLYLEEKPIEADEKQGDEENQDKMPVYSGIEFLMGKELAIG